MPLNTHPLVTHPLNAFDADRPETHDRAAYAIFRLVGEAVWNLAGNEEAGQVRDAFLVHLSTLHPEMWMLATCELTDVVAHLVEEEADDRSWTRTFSAPGFDWALARGLLLHDEVPLCCTWQNSLATQGTTVLLGGTTAVVPEPTLRDVSVLLALAGMALRALPDPHAALLRHMNPVFG